MILRALPPGRRVPLARHELDALHVVSPLARHELDILHVVSLLGAVSHGQMVKIQRSRHKNFFPSKYCLVGCVPKLF